MTMRAISVGRMYGFTLIEVLVAIAILGLVSAGVAGFFASIATTAARTNAEQEQTMEAKSFLESVALAWEDGSVFASSDDVPPGLTAPTGCTAASGSPLAGVKTLVLTCDDVDGPFVLRLGSVR